MIYDGAFYEGVKKAFMTPLSVVAIPASGYRCCCCICRKFFIFPEDFYVII